MFASNLPILLTLLIAISLIVAITVIQSSEGYVSAPSAISTKPILWFVVDDQVNTRKWFDFSSRTSNENNRGYTLLSYKVAQKTQGDDYQVVLLNGREETARMIVSYGGYVPENIRSIPVKLWNFYTKVALLANAGGLYVNGDATLFIGPKIKSFLQNKKAALFGSNPDEPITNSSSDGPGPSPFVGYAESSKQLLWLEAESSIKEMLMKGPSSYTAAIASRFDQKINAELREKGVDVIREAEYYLNSYDVFGRAPSKPDSSFDFKPSTAYVSFDSDLLERSAQLSWALKLSPEQIEESEFVFSRLVKKGLNY
jgi:hypothetical protein